jgi:hypothetical protein
MKRLVALVLCGTFLSSACASVSGARTTPPSPPHVAPRAADPALIAGYVRQLPVGARVRLSLADGRTVRGTLMYPERDPIVVQRRARIPEAPVEIPVKDILAVEVDTGKSGSAVRAMAIGAAAAAGATLGVIALLAAIFAD